MNLRRHIIQLAGALALAAFAGAHAATGPYDETTSAKAGR